MPIWPFKRRRRANTIPNTSSASTSNPVKDPSVSEKVKPSRQVKSAPASPPAVATPPPLPQTSKHGQLHSLQNDEEGPAQWSEKAAEKVSDANKENIPPPRHYISKEDITALPVTGRLENSPHLRPVDLERPPIPYNFRPQSMSQTSIQRSESITTKPPRPHTLHSKRSTQDYSSPARRTSSKQSKRKDEALREEEIRAMSAPIPIPKRPGEGPLRKESKKVRGLGGGKGSEVSLPAEGSVHSAMSGVVEQRGWEVGTIAAVFSPRPAIRLSGTPQGVVSSSTPAQSSGILYRIESIRGKQKAPPLSKNTLEAPPRTPRKKKTVGDQADELDASDIRLLMERDAKRREQKQRDRQEQLERKLRAREGRNRGDSDLRRRDAEEQKRIDEDRARAEQQIAAQGTLTPPTAVHPALRDMPSQDEPQPVGLGIAKQRESGDPMDIDRPDFSTPDAIAEEHESELMATGGAIHNPFTDDAALPPPASMPPTANRSQTSLPVESPMDEPIIATAQAIRMSQTHTPPLSPVYGARAPSSASQLPEAARQQSISAQSASAMSASSLPKPAFLAERRISDPPKERRAGAWASFFRRGTTLRRSQTPGKDAQAETSFSNISRESMKNQPLPAHLVDPDARRPPNVRSKSGTPVRTQSKFREDLPELPMSPPDSRTQSPDVTTMAAAVAAARRAGKLPPQPIEIPGSKRDSDLIETPGSERVRRHTAMAGSLASIDSEGSWLAGQGKRQSIQSALSRSYSKRNADQFTGSFEELGTDKDAEIVNRNIISRSRKVSSLTLEGAGPEEESEEDDTVVGAQQIDPLTVHESVRRKPTLVQNDPRLKSREGLVSEYAAIEPSEAASEVFETPAETPADIDNSDDEGFFPQISPEPELQRATSVKYVGRHSRQFSAGSARLLDVRRGSKSATPEPPGTAQSDAATIERPVSPP